MINMINTDRPIILRLTVRNDLVRMMEKEMIGDRRNRSTYEYFIKLIKVNIQYFLNYLHILQKIKKIYLRIGGSTYKNTNTEC